MFPSILLQYKSILQPKTNEKRSNIKSFITKINHNYTLAIEHYKLYTEKILIVGNSKVKKIDDNLLKKLAAELSKVVINWVDDSITLEKIYNGNLEQNTATNLNLALTPELTNTLKSNQDWLTGKGFVFEEYIRQKLSLKQFVEKNSSISAHNAVNNTLQELLQPLISNIETTGQTRSPSYLRQGNPYIRADLANTKDFENSELRLEFALTKQRKINELEDMLFQTNDDLQKLMQELRFGYSLKSYAYPTTNSIMQVSGLQNILNNMFDKSNNKTWNLNYAYYAMLEQISNLLLNIFGPLNIGFFFANGFYWTSTILEQNQAIMHIYGNPVSDIATQNLEIYQPHVYSNNLYLARIKLNNLSNLTTQFRLNTNYSKKSGNVAYYIQARIL